MLLGTQRLHVIEHVAHSGSLTPLMYDCKPLRHKKIHFMFPEQWGGGAAIHLSYQMKTRAVCETFYVKLELSDPGMTIGSETGVSS